jgi:hypothetical protein
MSISRPFITKRVFRNISVIVALLGIALSSHCFSQAPINVSNLNTQGKGLLKAISSRIKASPEASPFFKQVDTKSVMSDPGDLAKVDLFGPSAGIEITSSDHITNVKGGDGADVMWGFRWRAPEV